MQRPTPKQVRAEPPGPRLDAWVCHFALDMAACDDPDCLGCGCPVALFWTGREFEQKWHAPLAPSADWAAAGEVLAKLNADGRAVRLSNKTARGYFWCYVDDAVAVGRTWQEAISKAAVLAKLAEEEQNAQTNSR